MANSKLVRFFLFLVVTLTGALAGRFTVAADSQTPNVLLLICDDLNCDLGCYGHPLVKSPNIDRLAARGVLFERAYCQYPLCGPSRASLMTGLYPDQTLVRSNGIGIRERLPNVQTVAQLFRERGSLATRIGKIFHYGVPNQIGTAGHDDPLSWDDTINPRGRDKDDERLIYSVRPGDFGGYLSWLAAAGEDGEQTDGIAATKAVSLIEQVSRDDRRFFLAVGLYRPHTPYVAPRKYFDLYPPDSMVVPQIPAGYLDTLPPAARKSLLRKSEHVNLSSDLGRQAKQGYYAAVSFADAQLGRILDALAHSKAADNTIVIFTSDHGYHLGEHGHWLKTTLFENAARVPLIVAGPGIPAGQRTSSLAELVDLYPTLAELCGMSPPSQVSGVSLAPVLNDPRAVVRSSALTQLQDGYSIRTANFRYTEWGENGRDGAELYEHGSDPAEMKNVEGAPSHEQAKAELSTMLHDRVARVRQVPAGLEQIGGKKRDRAARR